MANDIAIKEDPPIVLNMIAGRDAKKQSIENLKGFSSTVVNKVFTEGKPLVVTGTDQGEALGSESAVLHNLRSIMAVPLKLGEKKMGVVYLDSTLAKGLFTQSDLEILAAISNQIAVIHEISRAARLEQEKAKLEASGRFDCRWK